MKLLKKIFNSKLSWEQHSFTNIVSSGERIVIFCSEDSNQTSSILAHILSWKHHFKQISIILPNYDYSFFKRIDKDETTTYFNINNDIKPFNNAVIFNFSSLKKIRKVLNHCKSSTILDINNPANLQFLPAPTDPEERAVSVPGRRGARSRLRPLARSRRAIREALQTLPCARATGRARAACAGAKARSPGTHLP